VGDWLHACASELTSEQTGSLLVIEKFRCYAPSTLWMSYLRINCRWSCVFVCVHATHTMLFICVIRHYPSWTCICEIEWRCVLYTCMQRIQCYSSAWLGITQAELESVKLSEGVYCIVYVHAMHTVLFICVIRHYPSWTCICEIE